ncbi:MAG: tetratricopeptide repeat protein [Candidatus Sericytochromatia bacterium]
MNKIIATLLISCFLLTTPCLAETAEDFFYKAYSNITEKNYIEAEKNLLEAIKINPNYINAYIELGILYKDKDEKKALEFFDKAIQIDDKKVNYTKIKDAYKKESNYDIPISYYKKYIDKYQIENSNIITDLYQISEDLYNTGKKDKALELQNYLISKFPKSGKLNYYLAIYNIKNNNINSYKKYADNTLAYIDYDNNCYCEFISPIKDLLIEKKYYTEALSFLNKVSKKLPIANIYVDIGNVYKTLNKLPEAKKNYNLALEIDSTNYEVLEEIGNLYFEESEKLLKNKNKPDLAKEKIFYTYEFFNSNCNLGYENNCIYSEEKIPELINESKGKKMNHYDYLLSGSVNLNNKKYDLAEKDLKKALVLNTKFDLAYIKLGSLYNDKNNPIKALEFYKLALEINPKLALAYNDIGLIYSKQNKVEKALLYLQRAYELDKNNPIYKNNLLKELESKAKGLYEKEKYIDTITTYTKLIQLVPKSSEYYKERGGTYIQLPFDNLKTPQNLKNGEKDLKKALELDKNNNAAKYLLGLVYLSEIEVGDKKEKTELEKKYYLAKKVLIESCEKNNKLCDLDILTDAKNNLKLATSKEELIEIANYSKLGKEYFESENFEKAISYYKLAYFLSSNSFESKKELLEVLNSYYLYLKELEEDEQAQEILEKYLKLKDEENFDNNVSKKNT